MQICNVLNYCDSFRLVKRCVGKAAFCSYKFTLETSNALEAESGILYIFNNIPSGEPRGESSGRNIPNEIAISSMALRK